jgi:hypothetical protein
MGRTLYRQGLAEDGIMTQTKRSKKALKLKIRCHGLKEKWQLFVSITVWVIVAVAALLVLCRWFLGSSVLNLHPHVTDILEVVRISLTVVGGIGAVGYLVIKYQERQAERRDELRAVRQLGSHLFNEAIGLFGSENAITRMAGVHALIKVGNADPSLQQEIINLLCGYLRSKRNQDSVCESLIIDLLAGALSDDGGVEWRDDLFLDLHGAKCVENFYLSKCTLRGMDLDGATFDGGFMLDNITIDGTFQCPHTEFKGEFSLQDCIFQEGADFSGTHAATATCIERTTFCSRDTGKEQDMVTASGSHFKTRKEHTVNLVGAEFLGWFFMKDVAFDTDCLLAYPSNFSYLDGRSRNPATFGTFRTMEDDKSISSLSNFEVDEVTFNESLLIDGVDPMYLSTAKSVTIGREDVENYVCNYIERKNRNQVR